MDLFTTKRSSLVEPVWLDKLKTQLQPEQDKQLQMLPIMQVVDRTLSSHRKIEDLDRTMKQATMLRSPCNYLKTMSI